MNVRFAAPTIPSRALARVERALKAFAPPSVTFAPGPALTILPVVGRLDRIKQQLSGKYAIIQYCLRSTQKPHTRDWMPIWRGAKLVYSYYHLPSLCLEDSQYPDFNFYHAPLGVDPAVFCPSGSEKHYVVGSHGPNRLSEGSRELARATDRVNGRMFHLGPTLRLEGDVTFAQGMSDAALAGIWSQCRWVSGLRRKEGFELPAAEGLLCGARPLLYDTPTYRQWYGTMADYVPERSRPDVEEALVELFTRDYRPVTGEELDRAKALFNWERIAEGFWTRLLRS